MVVRRPARELEQLVERLAVDASWLERLDRAPGADCLLDIHRGEVRAHDGRHAGGLGFLVVSAAPVSEHARERVFSGMRPTGRLHIGHWFGALSNWVELQDSYDCIYCVVDLHALTTGFEDVSKIHEDGIEMLADWIGAGVDPERSIVFRQSQVPEHAELALLLGMITPKSWLERVPTYKGQIAELGEEIDTFGFFGYPLLQTADIILYHATKVPVGQDQLPHLELAREVLRRFNYLYGGGEGDEGEGGSGVF